MTNYRDSLEYWEEEPWCRESRSLMTALAEVSPKALDQLHHRSAMRMDRMNVSHSPAASLLKTDVENALRGATCADLNDDLRKGLGAIDEYRRQVEVLERRSDRGILRVKALIDNMILKNAKMNER